MRQLHILFSLPQEQIPSGQPILSFLEPLDQSVLEESLGEQVLVGAQEMDQVRESARKLYIDLVARMGATPCGGETLRQSLRSGENKTLWWYHPVTTKSPEDNHESIFDLLLLIFTISNVANREAIEKIVINGGPAVLVSMLHQYNPTASVVPREESDLKILLKGFAARGLYLWKNFKNIRLVHRNTSAPIVGEIDVAFQGFWDWSVRVTPDGKLQDVYFKELPEVLPKSWKKGWLLWFSRDDVTLKGRDPGTLLQQAKGQKELIFLQRFLKIQDLLRAIFTIKPLLSYLKFRKKESFRELFIHQGLDYFPIFRRSLLYHFCSSALPHHELAEIAHSRAVSSCRPKIALTFQELFLWSRPFYYALKNHSPKTQTFTVQHASYNREKTFVVIDPVLEFEGAPDGLAIPTPNSVFVTGELGRQIFAEDGYPDACLHVTGTPRYNHLQVQQIKANGVEAEKNRTVLLALSLNRSLEFTMVSAAVLAARKIPEIRLVMRSHPHGKMEDWPAMQPLLPEVEISKATLQEDLERADLVLFTYSTVAEEALLQGKPIWKWEYPGFNGSVFRDLPVVPRFFTVKELHEGFLKFLTSPENFLPSPELQQHVLEWCFHKADGESTQRVADILIRAHESV